MVVGARNSRRGFSGIIPGYSRRQKRAFLDNTSPVAYNSRHPMATTGTPRRPGTSGPDAPRRGNGKGTPARTAPGGRRRKPKRRGFWHKLSLFFLSIMFVVLIVVIAAAVFLILQFKQVPQGITLPTTPNGRTSAARLQADAIRWGTAFP